MTHSHAQLDALTEPPALSGSVARPEAYAVERRVARRVDLSVGVGFRSASNFYTGFTSDISEGGLFVATHMLQPIGSELTLVFALPTGPEISVRGTVRWLRDTRERDASAPPGMGVQFQAMNAADLERVGKLVALRDPIFFGR